MSGDPFWLAFSSQGLDVSPAVRAFHEGTGSKHYSGRATITRGKHVLVRLALWLSGLPPASERVPVHLTLRTTKTEAEWVRDFGGHITRSRLRFDAKSGCVVEKFGPFRLTMRMKSADEQLLVHVEKLSVFGVGVPSWMCPVSATREFEDSSGRFCFDVSGRMPGLGLVIRYAGTVAPD